jgi:hypothetical protein
MVCLQPWTGPRQAQISGNRRLELAPEDGLQRHLRVLLRNNGR